MWRNYVTVGVRSLIKSRVYALINIAGLAIGMAACLMILLFVRYETGYDRWLKGSEDAYQVQSYFKDRNSSRQLDLQMAAYVSKAALVKDFPQIEKAVFVTGVSAVILKDGQASPAENFQFVDGPLTDILRFPYMAGDPATALTRPGSIVLTQTEAQRRFGAAPAIGKTLTVVTRGRPTDYRVTGVIRDIPKNSHFKASFIARFDPESYFADGLNFLTSWGWQSGWVYLRLRPGTDVAAINAALPEWEKRNIPNETLESSVISNVDLTDYALVNVRDVHLGRGQVGVMTPTNNVQSIVTFAVIALLILGMACVNFTNLATARASQRAREVALRKVLGASKRQLIVQFLGESILMAAVAMLVALAIVEIVLPWFAQFLKADLSLQYFGADGILLPVFMFVLVVGIIGGAYPAFYLSRFQPAQVLKANKSAADAEGSGRLRNMLVVAQFAVSIGLIICTAIIYGQTNYARTSDPGYKRDGLIQVDNLDRREIVPISETLAREVGRLEDVVAVGRSQLGVASYDNRNNAVRLPGAREPVLIGNYFVDTGFFRAMGMRLIAGRSFIEGRAMDDSTTPIPQVDEAERALSQRGASAVINELGVKKLGFASAADAVGKTIKVSGSIPNSAIPLTIIGVVNDVRFRSIRQPMDAILFEHHRFGHNAMIVRYRGDPALARQRIEAVWRRLAPQVPFEARLSEEIVGQAYEAEVAHAQIFAAFALLAVIIGCLGLLGLAAFTAERRTKEIGIRKVLGASTGRIVQLLVWQFSRPVLIANLIAWPIAWWVMRDWLNGFDTRMALGPLPFVIAGAIALLIAIGTIAGHAFRVARTNPIHALRYE